MALTYFDSEIRSEAGDCCKIERKDYYLTDVYEYKSGPW